MPGSKTAPEPIVVGPQSPIETLDLPTWPRNALRAEGVDRIEQLLALDERKLRGFPRIGQTGIAQIRTALAAKGYRLAEAA